MRRGVLIAFDLDDTLVPCGTRFETESPQGASRILCSEPLRAGTIGLVRALREAGHRIGVYTTSARPRASIYLNFLAYGVSLKRIVTEPVHHTQVRRGRGMHCQKYPPHFGIDALVDDSVAVLREGKRLGYRVIRIRPDDHAWASRILKAISRIDH